MMTTWRGKPLDECSREELISIIEALGREMRGPLGQREDLIEERPCTCHPDDHPPVPCPRKYALSECRAADRLRIQGAEEIELAMRQAAHSNKDQYGRSVSLIRTEDAIRIALEAVAKRGNS